ncbi:MAG: ABC transporter permease, partial [Bacteroidota bacterium]
MTQLLLKNFWRSRALMVGLLLLFLTGLVSLHIGKIFLDRQQDIVEQTSHMQEENIERQLKYVNGHIGLLLYYLKFGYANETPALAGLSIGNRDVHPAVLNVNIRNLEEQKHSSELMNPFYQLLGNMDFSFVL